MVRDNINSCIMVIRENSLTVKFQYFFSQSVKGSFACVTQNNLTLDQLDLVCYYC